MKEENSLKLIETVLKSSNNPVCLTSFGKDSLVMLHLIRRVSKVPVIYWREPYFQSKSNHAQKVINDWDLDVYDYPPTLCDYIQLDDYFEVYNFYYVNGIDWINLLTGIRKYNKSDKRVLCAIDDLINRPKVSTYQFKWDCVFHGHKQSDPIHISKPVELKEIVKFGNGLIVLPIKDWTDQDIWDYIKKYDLPYNKERYDLDNEKENNDKYPTCYDCLDLKNKGKKVHCFKKGCKVDFVGKSKEHNEEFKNFLLSKFYKR